MGIAEPRPSEAAQVPGQPRDELSLEIEDALAARQLESQP